jgi:uncharacterized protein
MALFCGGLAQLLAGMWEFPRGNTFAATGRSHPSRIPILIFNFQYHTKAFTSYGAFWMSFATIFIPNSGIAASYKDPGEFDSAVGIYLITWFMVTFFLLYAPNPFLPLTSVAITVSDHVTFSL